MNHLVKLTARDDGEPVPKKEQVWCLSVVNAGSDSTLCTGEFYGYGEGGAKFRVKTLARGGITCPQCITLIKEIKAVRL